MASGMTYNKQQDTYENGIERTYKIFDHEGNKEYWRDWEYRMNRAIEDSNYEFDWSDSGWCYED